MWAAIQDLICTLNQLGKQWLHVSGAATVHAGASEKKRLSRRWLYALRHRFSLCKIILLPEQKVFVICHCDQVTLPSTNPDALADKSNNRLAVDDVCGDLHKKCGHTRACGQGLFPEQPCVFTRPRPYPLHPSGHICRRGR